MVEVIFFFKRTSTSFNRNVLVFNIVYNVNSFKFVHIPVFPSIIRRETGEVFEQRVPRDGLRAQLGGRQVHAEHVALVAQERRLVVLHLQLQE